jgi:hypothetical protein
LVQVQLPQPFLVKFGFYDRRFWSSVIPLVQVQLPQPFLVKFGFYDIWF